MRALVPVVLFIALASCGAGKQLASIRVSSSAFEDGQPIPRQYTCDGANQRPEVSWGEAPKETRSFALVVDDPDAPGGTFRHWGMYDLPPTARSIAAGRLAINDMGNAGYDGPCPPKGHGPHHYHFKLFALDVDHLMVPNKPKVIDVENAAREHAIAQGELIGTYERR